MSDSIESSFIDKGTHYHIQLRVQQSDTFSVLLFDDDQPDRWEGIFNGQIIKFLTTKSGNIKNIQVFYKMLQNAILGTSTEVSFTLLSQSDVDEMKSGLRSQSTETNNSMPANSNESKYFILDQKTEFDRVKYPLRLMNKPYSTEDLKSMIRNLRSENKRLSSFENNSLQQEKVRNLEQQIYDLNGAIRQLAEEKDEVINNLKKKITDLENKSKLKAASKSPINNGYIQKNNRVNSNLRNSKKMISTIGRQTSTIAKSKYSSASSSRKTSRNSSASNSRKSSASNSRKSSASNSRPNSARSSASGSRPSSRNGSFKRFNPTEWVLNHQRSSGGSRNNSRNPSPSNRQYSSKNYSSNKENISQNDAHLKRLRSLVQKKYF